jgi:hypothetical protein
VKYRLGVLGVAVMVSLALPGAAMALVHAASTAQLQATFGGTSTGVGGSVYTNVLQIKRDAAQQDFIDNEMWHDTDANTGLAWFEVGVTEGQAGTYSCGQYINGTQTSPCNPNGPAYRAYFDNPRFFWAHQNDSSNYFEHFDTNDSVILDHWYQMSIHKTSGCDWEIAIYNTGTKLVDDTGSGNCQPGIGGGDYAGVEDQFPSTDPTQVSEDGEIKNLQYWNGSSWISWPNNGYAILSDWPGDTSAGTTATWASKPTDVLDCATYYPC